MKLVILSDHYPPFIEGGAEIMCATVADGLIQRGNDVKILTSDFGAEASIRKENVSRILKYLDINRDYDNQLARRFSHISHLLKSIRNYYITKRFLAHHDPDLVMICLFEYVSLLPLFAVQDLGKHHLYAVHYHWPEKLKQKYEENPSWLRKLYYSFLIAFRRFRNLQINRAVFVSQTLADDTRKAGFKIEKQAVIYNGILDEWVKKDVTPYQSVETWRLMYAGRLEADKGIDVILQAMDLLVNHLGYQQVAIDLYGKGDDAYVSRLKAFLEEHDLTGHVRLKGFISRDVLIKQYEQHHILILATLKYEGLPTVILEAMSQGTLVIASEIGAAKEILKDCHAGYLTPPGDAAALAQTIKQCTEDVQEVNEVRKRALKRIQESFVLTKMIDQYEQYLLEFVQENEHSKVG